MRFSGKKGDENMNNDNGVDGLRYKWSSGKTIPTVYQNVLSYEEQLQMLICDLFGFKKELDNLQDSFNNLAESTKDLAIQEAIKILKKEFTELKTELLEMYTGFLDDINGENSKNLAAQHEQFIQWRRENMNVLRDIQKRMVVMQSHINTLSLQWVRALANISYFNAIWQKNAERDLTDKIESKMGADITVQNPVNRLYENLNKVLNDLYQLQMNVGGIRVQEFADLKITVDEWEKKNITVDAFLYNARVTLNNELIKKPLYSYVDGEIKKLRDEIIGDYNRLEGALYVTNAFTGEQQFITNAVTFLFNLHQKEGITVADFNELDETVNDFAERKLQVYTFAVQGIK